MGQDKSKKDRILLQREMEEEGSLFEDIEVEDISDEFLKLRSYRKSTAFFRAMVVVPEFPLSPGASLHVREFGIGRTDERGRIYGPDGKEYSSLSLMARAVMPEIRTVDKRDQIERAATPDGWDVIHVQTDSGEAIKLSTLFYDNWSKIGLEMEQFSSDKALIEGMERLGYGEVFADLKPKNPPKKAAKGRTLKK